MSKWGVDEIEEDLGEGIELIRIANSYVKR